MPNKSPRRTNDSLIARLRMERGLTQADLAALIGCYPKDICRWETGKRIPSTKSLVKLAAALGVPMEQLI